jgi:hypothetical protein
MRKLLVLLIVLCLAGAGYLGYAHFSGGAVPTFGLAIGGESAIIRQQALRFFEHIKFKNISALKDFVKEGSEASEISEFITKTIGFQPANVDLQSLAVESVEIDSTKKRARAKVHLAGLELSERRQFDVTKVIFLYLDEKNQWLIDIDTLSP